MKAFIKDALSESDGASAKRMLAFLAFLVAVIVFLFNVFYDKADVQFEHYFDTLLMFSGALLGFTAIEKFKIRSQPPSAPSVEGTQVTVNNVTTPNS